jgi:putative photosynthetic complex assembly protein 2
MTGMLCAVATAVAAWWLSTGLVLILVRLANRAERLSAVLATTVAIVALAGLAQTARQSDLAGIYGAFACALLAWTWHELTFLCGWITGPRRCALPGGLRGWQRFVQSLRAILWHELGIAVVALVIVALAWGQPNQVGVGTFLVLWVMRASAKLNLFLGVRNLSEQFLPDHLVYLQSFFRRRRMNAFFPLAVGLALLALAAIIAAALHPDASPAESAGHTLVATMLALAIVEHAMLVLPLDTVAPWRWALAQRPVKGSESAQPAPTPREPVGVAAAGSDEKLLHAR